jgi:ComF family protein
MRLAEAMSTHQQVVHAARRVGSAILNAVLPPLCLSCAGAVGATGQLCATCWTKIVWLGTPLCTCCGMPFEFEAGTGDDAFCGACLKQHPRFARARAVFRYDDASKGLVLSFKHADRTHGAPAYGRWLARAGAALIGDCDLIAPVPLHWTRLAWRRYNQAALLAVAVARETGRVLVPDLLVRSRRTVIQGQLGRGARRRNVRGAFRLNPRYLAEIREKRILLIDDVFTTGATAEECARVLLKGGAVAVDVLTLARVVRSL